MNAKVVKNFKETLDQIANKIVEDELLLESGLFPEEEIFQEVMSKYGFSEIELVESNMSTTAEFSSHVVLASLENEKVVALFSGRDGETQYLAFYLLEDLMKERSDVPLDYKLKVMSLQAILEFV